MNKARFSIYKYILNSIEYNGLPETLRTIAGFILIKLKMKKSISIKKNKKGRIYLRNGTSDFPAFRQVFMDHEYLINVDRQSIKTIIDGGCNIGLASLYFAAQFPNAKIAGIEPDAKNYSQAVLNTQAWNKINIVQAGIWNKNCFLETQSDSSLGEWGITVKESPIKSNHSIKAMTVDAIMEQNNFQIIDILKLDIEGSEFEVFQSGYQLWLPKTRIIIIELHDFMKKNCSSVFFKALSDSGITYSLSQRGENLIVFNTAI
jgi:FkbM family methyltransferase